MIDEPDKRHRWPYPKRRVIGATCTTCAVANGFSNWSVTKRDDGIEFDAHCTGSCVIRLDDAGSRLLFETLQQWLG